MQLSAKEKESAVRFSFDTSCTQKAADELFEAVKEICLLFT
jgi:cysteine sulfinate desulfinase/cysteine desulfurase-like protein